MVRSHSQCSQLKRIWGKILRFIHQKPFKNTVFQVAADGKVKIKTKKQWKVQLLIASLPGCLVCSLDSLSALLPDFSCAASHMDDHVFICSNISEQVTACSVISTTICYFSNVRSFGGQELQHVISWIGWCH